MSTARSSWPSMSRPPKSEQFGFWLSGYWCPNVVVVGNVWNALLSIFQSWWKKHLNQDMSRVDSIKKGKTSHIFPLNRSGRLLITYIKQLLIFYQLVRERTNFTILVRQHFLLQIWAKPNFDSRSSPFKSIKSAANPSLTLEFSLHRGGGGAK